MSDDQPFELDLNKVADSAPAVGIVDADSITYQLGWYYEKADLLPPGHFNQDSAIPEFVITAVESHLKKLKLKMGVDILHLHLTAGNKNQVVFEDVMGRPMLEQFRNTLGNSYKSNREELSLPVGYHFTLRALLQEPNTYIHDQWEADEAVILHKKLNPTWVLSSNDKDVYKQHYGKNWLYDKRQRWEDIPKDFANYFAFLQAITGDPVDGFIGVKGIGEKGAAKFVNVNNTPEQNWEGVLNAYKSKGLGEAEALLNMRFANMSQLRLDDKGAPYIDLWEPTEYHLSPQW